MRCADRALITPETGVAGDFRGRPGPRQVTLLFEQDWLDACAEQGEQRDWTIRRANLLIRGLQNPRSEGGLLWVGPVLLEITGECAPCSAMDRQWSGLTASLTPQWRGGLLARVMQGGEASVGSPVRWAPAERPSAPSERV
jgi:MOSC domain-containing protein YiiM